MKTKAIENMKTAEMSYLVQRGKLLDSINEYYAIYKGLESDPLKLQERINQDLNVKIKYLEVKEKYEIAKAILETIETIEKEN